MYTARYWLPGGLFALRERRQRMATYIAPGTSEEQSIAENKVLVAKYPFLCNRDDDGNIPEDYDYTWT